MPLTEKGKKILKNMKSEYGAEKGKEVFYASQNKGTIKGTHKTSEANSPAWLTGFIKGAAELGIQDPAQVQELLKVAHRLHLLNTHGEAYTRGFDKEAQLGAGLAQVAKGLAKNWKPLLGAGTALGAGLAAPHIGRAMGLRPFNLSNYTMQDIEGLRGDWDQVSRRMRNATRQPGDYTGPRTSGYFSPWGGYYTTQ